MVLLGSTLPGLAQQVLPAPTDELRPNELLQDRYDRRGQIPTIDAYPVQVTALADADLGFNDNIFAQSTGLKSDFFFDVGAKLHTNYQRDAFTAVLDTSVLDHQFVTLTTENFWEANARLSLHEALTDDFAYLFQGGVQRLAVPRTDPNPINGRTPATYLLFDALPGVSFGSGQGNLLTLSLGYDQTIFDNIQGLNGPVDATQRNRTEFLADLRLDHFFFGQQEVFVELRPDTRNYQQKFDSSGFLQSSNGGRADTGFVFDLNSLFLITVSGGWQQQDYAEPRFGAIGVPDATVDVRWSPTLLTQLDAKYIHEYAEDIDVNAPINSPGYTHNEGILALQHELRRDILLSLLVSDDFRDLERSPTRFNLVDVGPKVQYRLAEGISLALNYDHVQLSSNIATHYSDDIALFTVKKQF
ncbi:MAG: outer membrane beta-barrel protein [Aliidongia sp.]